MQNRKRITNHLYNIPFTHQRTRAAALLAKLNRFVRTQI